MKKINIKEMLIIFVVIFILTFGVGAITTYLYSLIAYNNGIVDWETSFRFAFILGIVLSIIEEMKNKKDNKRN